MSRLHVSPLLLFGALLLLLSAACACGSTVLDVPYKYAVEHVPPRKIQYLRGTCWDFALVALIEHAYRAQGIANNLLPPTQYVDFSEQAFGNMTVQLCATNPKLCMFPYDNIAYGSTEGGENNILYLFKKQLYNALLPQAVCPYVPAPSPTSENCDNAAAALRSNPIQVNVTGYHLYYDVPSIKKALATSGRSMDFGTAVHMSFHYLPCDHRMANAAIYAGRCPAATAAASEPCPDANCPSTFRSKCCIKLMEDAWSFNGEFRSHGDMSYLAGHTMLLTGYNDEFTTEAGLTGGFIMRNSWMDSAFSSMSPLPDGVHSASKTRGSHSMAYFLNQISANDERMLCPNSANPRNWYIVADEDDAVNPNTFLLANASFQPFHLRCVSLKGECNRDPAYVYYLLALEPTDDQLVIGQFVEVNTATGAKTTLTLAPRILDTIAWVFLPWENETLPNSDDYCGYYFWPYDLMRRENAKFGGFYVMDYELSFSPQSYLAKAKFGSGLDYSWIAKSTKTQKPLPVFDDAFPNDLIYKSAAVKQHSNVAPHKPVPKTKRFAPLA